MAEPIGALRAELSANHAAFEADMGKARSAVQKNASAMQTAMNKVGDSFNNALTTVNRFGGMAAAAAVGGMAIFIKKAIDSADEISKMSQKVGVATETLSTLKYAADLSDVSMDALSTSLMRLSRNVQDASLGTGDAKDAFAALGVAFKTESGALKSTESLLMELATKFKGLPDGVDKTALAMKLFGRAGAEMIPLLNQGASGIAALQKRAEQLGLKLSTEAGQKAEEFNDQLKDLKTNATGFGVSVATKLLPWLNEYIKVIRTAYEESGPMMGLWVALGGFGEAIFKKGLDAQIRNARKELEGLEASKKARIDNTPYALPATAKVNRIEDKRIAEAKGRLEGLLMVQTDLTNQAWLEAEAKREAKRLEDKAKEKAAQDLRDKLTAEANAEKKKQEAIKLAQEIRDENKKIWLDQAKFGEEQEKEREDAGKRMLDEKTKEDQEYRAERVRNLKAVAALEEANTEEVNRLLGIKKITMEEIKEIYESTRTPAEQYLKIYERLSELLDAGAISVDTYIRAVTKARDAVVNMADTGKDKFEELKQVIEGWGKSSADAITEFAMTGKTSFKDMVNSMIRDIMRMIVYQNITGPLATAISGGVKGIMGGDGLFGGGRASGGPVSPGKMYEVNERGAPELLSVGNRQFLMMGKQAGNVSAGVGGGAAAGGGGGDVKIIVNNSTGQQVGVSQRDISFNAQEMIVTLWLDAAQNNKFGLGRALGR